MATILLLSLSGSPGATTAGLALAQAWERSVILAEVDTSHSSSVLSGYLRGQVPWQPANVVNLAVAAARHGSISHNDVWAQLRPLDADTVDQATRYLLPGVVDPRTSTGLGRIWADLGQAAETFDSAGIDVLFDAGRWDVDDPRTPLLHSADAVLVVARPSLSATFAIHARLAEIQASLKSVGHTKHLMLLAVDDPHTGYTATEVAATLQLPLIASLPHDPASAAVYSDGATAAQRFARKALPRAAAQLVSALRTATGRNRGLVDAALSTELEGL
ncbi:hypothetical protein SPF06_21465 [Sinomonas sp. JGH33]|uniref:Cellulose biosynthesis protein BcsQ n=1 Tax=Sinomonas terricola TaxID=3110330 RepID=A0ABU5TC81_9MICC|nr:hypothetical protein [Sinomonas sp. JGH33]MEA5457294.1 hypothetical protein [Sinomonas sp. JGH33]